jgi:glutamyl-tRNA synthetase
MSKIVVRNCPSPTGLFHIGTLRVALYNYLFAKKNGGEILFRSEDTDKIRSTKEYEQDIYNGLVATSMIPAGTKIYRQSENTENYKKYLKKLLDEDKAYYCFMTSEELEAERAEQIKNKKAPRYSGKFRNYPKEEAYKRLEAGEKYVIRLKVPQEKDIVFTDLIRGENKTNTRELADFVIAKDLETPLYNFVVVIDDHEMGVTHVMRGEDHIPNTPKQILIYNMLGFKLPEFAHFPLILNADKSKLSKRKNKTSVNDYLKEGYLIEALLNFLVLLGWNDGTEKEIFSLEEMVEVFSLERVHKGGAVFDLRKLDWLNGMYIRNLEFADLKARITPYLENCSFKESMLEKGDAYFDKCLASVQEKMKKLSEVSDLLHFYYEDIEATKELICNPKMKVTEEIASRALTAALEVFESLGENDFEAEKIKQELIVKIEELGLKNGQMLWPIRAVLTGVEASPGAFEVAEILGREEVLRKLKRSLF